MLEFRNCPEDMFLDMFLRRAYGESLGRNEPEDIPIDKHVLGLGQMISDAHQVQC